MTTEYGFPPPKPSTDSPGSVDWDYRRHSGAMRVVRMVAAALALWLGSGLLFWGMIAAFSAAGEGSYSYYTGRYEDNSVMIIPGIIALALGILCWVGAVFCAVKAVFRILEFHAELSAVEIVRRWRTAEAADAVNETRNSDSNSLP